MLLVCLCGFGSSGANAGNDAGILVGPINAQVLRIIDGDTIAVRATIWPGQHIDVSVRLAGIDVPELRSRCVEDRALAWRARNLVHDLIAGTAVHLFDVRHGKYAGRVVARVRTRRGVSIANLLLARGLAQPSTHRRRFRMRASRGCRMQTAQTRAR